MNKFLTGTVTLGFAGMMTVAANAAPLTGSFALSIWNADESSNLTCGIFGTCQNTSSSPAQQALPTNPLVTGGVSWSGTTNLLSDTGTYTGALNFNLPSNGTNTVNAFFNSAGGSVSSISNSILQADLSDSGYTHNTLMKFVFTITQTETLTITHDDGISIWNSSDSHEYLDASAPTSSEVNSVTLGAGTYDLWYMEANGLPAELEVAVPAVPEPASMVLLGVGLVGLGLIRRRRG